MQKWTPLPLDQPLYKNADPDAVVGFQTAMENGFLNDQGAQIRFPGFVDFATLDDNGRVFLNDINGNLIASTDKGFVYRIDPAGNVTRLPGDSVSGGGRTVFAKSDREMFMAAGGPIVRLRQEKTELLSGAAPLATHVGWLDGFVIAAEKGTGRFYHSTAGTPDEWDPLDTFSTDSNPDIINALIVTPFRELLISGPASMEQFERDVGADVPFFRRWATGSGVSLPYGMVFADNALWAVNELSEVVRIAGQVPEVVSEKIGVLLEAIDDWRDAWMGGFPDRPLHALGQKFLILQAPRATNAYGTKGVTLLFDYRNRRWSELYGWDDARGLPTRWPGWSHWRLWNRTFIGGEGRIYELATGTFAHAGATQRWLVRTARLQSGHQAHVNGFRLHLKRGGGGNTDEPFISVRCSRDGRPLGNTIRRGLGRAGHANPVIEFGAFGIGSTFQFEISSGANCDIQLIKAEAMVLPVGP